MGKKRPPPKAKSKPRPRTPPKAPPPVPPVPPNDDDPHGEPANDPNEVMLSDTEITFVDAYMISGCAASAYRVAHPQSSYINAQRNSHKLRNRPWVNSEIVARRAAVSRRANLTAERALSHAADLAWASITDVIDRDTGHPVPPNRLPVRIGRLVQSIRVLREAVTTSTQGETTTQLRSCVLEYRLKDSSKPLALIFQHLGLDQPMPPLDVLIATVTRLTGGAFSMADMKKASATELAARDTRERQRVNQPPTGPNPTPPPTSPPAPPTP